MKAKVYKVGGFMAWLLRFYSRGKEGEMLFSVDGISYKNTYSIGTILQGYLIPARFNCKLSDIIEIRPSRYITYWFIPLKCLQIKTKNRKSFKFCFHSEEDAKNFMTFCSENNINNSSSIGRGAVSSPDLKSVMEKVDEFVLPKIGFEKDEEKSKSWGVDMYRPKSSDGKEDDSEK